MSATSRHARLRAHRVRQCLWSHRRRQRGVLLLGGESAPLRTAAARRPARRSCGMVLHMATEAGRDIEEGVDGSLSQLDHAVRREQVTPDGSRLLRERRLETRHHGAVVGGLRPPPELLPPRPRSGPPAEGSRAGTAGCGAVAAARSLRAGRTKKAPAQTRTPSQRLRLRGSPSYHRARALTPAAPAPSRRGSGRRAATTGPHPSVAGVDQGSLPATLCAIDRREIDDALADDGDARRAPVETATI